MGGVGVALGVVALHFEFCREAIAYVYCFPHILRVVGVAISQQPLREGLVRGIRVEDLELLQEAGGSQREPDREPFLRLVLRGA